MTSREKVLKALNRESGPVPVDFGSTAVTGMHCTCVAALRDHYGLKNSRSKFMSPIKCSG